VAAVQTGTEPVLLRLRLEYALLTIARDDKGLIVAALPSKTPGENDIARLVPQDAVLQMLENYGFCKKKAAWLDVLNSKLPARRLPGSNNEGGRLLIFEKKTVTATPNPSLSLPDMDLSHLRPEDLEKYNLNKTSYSYMGFYQAEGDAEPPLYQPLRLTLSESGNGKTPKPPTIQSISYEYFQWEVTQKQAHHFENAAAAPVALQTGKPLRPLTEWRKPTDAWFYDADGWVYYGQSLQPGAMTPLLLQSFSVGPTSPLVKEENRFRLRVRTQGAPLDRNKILALWHTGKSLDGIGSNSMSNEAARLATELLGKKQAK
jgi:hypothetical protein